MTQSPQLASGDVERDGKMEYQVVHLPVDALRSALYNPPRRAEMVADLVRAIEKSGYMKPLDVTKDNVIIDGHRRLAAARALGWKTVPVVRHPEENASVIYAALNSAVRRPSGNDNLYVFLSAPDAVNLGARRGMAAMQEALGIDLLQRLADSGGSIATYKQAAQIADYCGVRQDHEWLRAIVRWLLDTRQTYKVRKALEDGIDPRSLLRAVETGKVLRRGWDAE